jgi:heme-degrading monooxygenase HmoA
VAGSGFWEDVQMATLFVRVTVADYKAWRKIFDEFQPTAAGHGFKSTAVYQTADNPNEVTVMHDFDSVESARTFTQAEDLKDAMQRSGVIGAPTIRITNKV